MEPNSTHDAYGLTNRQGRDHQLGLSQVEDSCNELDSKEMQAVDRNCDSTMPVIICHSAAIQPEPGRKHVETEVMENTCDDEDGGCFLIVLLMAGYSKGIAIVFVEYIEVFDAPASKTTLLFWVITGTYSIASVLTMHILLGAIGIRKTVMLGVMLNVIAMVTAIFAKSITYLICTHSLLMGASSAMVQPPCFVILGHYFKKRRGLATTMSVSGVSLGGIIFPRLIRFLVDEYSIRGAMLILTGLSMNMWIGALLLRPLESFQTTKKIASLEDETEKEPAAKKCIVRLDEKRKALRTQTASTA
ncbi:monocarboxylate transporter 13-like [Haliotis rubra]|uniref:monocarboxylate transporter 13-like n=1 Tax=Haliotis rubra TaxID=36100 RepID=UPI001EE5CF39|nr:monocarboxylate transporter 13-like [Haliotis rubra]